MCFWRGLYFVLKNVLVIPNIYSRVGILDSPWFINSCRAYQELGQGDLDSFDQEKLPLLIYLLPTHKKCNHKKNHNYLNLV